jgi:CheY-like chemotaxis protein
LVDLMGGEIRMESEAGRGSTFHFSVRLAAGKAARPATRVIDAGLLQGVRVLIVDDNATNRRILEEMTRLLGMRPESVDGGRAALRALAEAADAGTPFGVVLLDGMMPGMDGLMTAAEIRKDRSHGAVRVILLTSADRLIDETRRGELGIVNYLVKPVHSADLQAALAEAMSGLSQGPRSMIQKSGNGEGSARSLRVLLAEDNAVNQMLAVALLKKQGHQVTVAKDGREALAALERESFDLVLMDVMMPEMDGFEATSVIREREKQTGGRLPIIALTANAMKGDREECLKAGMDD